MSNLQDWVRFELANAISWGKCVIPVASQDFSFDELKDLPDLLCDLPQLNFTRVHFDAPSPVVHGCIHALGDALCTELRRTGPEGISAWTFTDGALKEVPAAHSTEDTEASSPKPQRRFDSVAQLADVCDLAFNATFLLLGYGDRGLYADFEAVTRDIGLLCEELHREYGKGRWALMFGGDTLDPTRPDIAMLARWIQTEMGVPLIAVQCQAALAGAGLDDHVDMVLAYSTHRNFKGAILWGGWSPEDGLRGASREYFSDAMLERRLLKGVIVAGGGLISRQDCVYAMHVGVPVCSVRAEPRFLEAVWKGTVPSDCCGRQGPVDYMLDAIDDRGALHRCGMWLKLNRDIVSILDDPDLANPHRA